MNTLKTLNKGINFSANVNLFKATFKSPSRPIGSFKEECYKDAESLRSQGPFYVLFSTGVDSQIIARSFKDNNIDCEYVFLNFVNTNNVELSRIHECKKFYNIDIRIVDLDLEKLKDSWISRCKEEKTPALLQYPFEHLSSILEKDYPIVVQGANDPAIITDNKTFSKASIYLNYFESSLQRHRLMSKYRPVIDFPFSPEAITSYYTNINLKTFCRTIRYFKEISNIKNISVGNTDYFNTFAKPYVKGLSFEDSIIWYGKLTGYENIHDWAADKKYNIYNVLETRISVPYWDLVSFLEGDYNQTKDYTEWHYKNSDSFFTSLGSL